MNDKPSHDMIGKDDLIIRTNDNADPSTDELLKETMFLVELLRECTAPILNDDPGKHDPALIAALVVYAGAVHGQMLAMDMCRDMTKEAVTAMLLTNWNSGVGAGRRKVERLAREMGVDPTTGKPPEGTPS